MERRYYLLKIAIVVLAIVTAGVGTGMGTTKVAGEIGAHTRYSAASEIEAAAWHATAYVGHTLAHFFSLTVAAIFS